MVVCVLLVDGMHRRAKFVAVIRFGGRLDIGQQRKRELWDTNDYTICGLSCRIQLHQFHVDADLLAKVEGVVNDLDQLLQHVVCEWSVGESMAKFITLYSVNSSMHLWLLPLAVQRMASVMLLPTNLVMASTTPPLMPMTN